MPIFIIETVADSPIREFWQIEAGSHQEARAMFSDGHCGKFLWDEVTGDETNRDISEVHTFADLASTITLHNAQQEAPAMLAALRKISQGADCFTFNSDADAFRFVDMVAEAVAPILARIDGAAPAPTAQPAGAIGEAGHAAAIEAAQGYVSDPAIWNAPSPDQIAGLLQLLGVGLAPVAANDDADMGEGGD